MTKFMCNIDSYYQQAFLVIAYLISYIFIVLVNECLDTESCKGFALSFHTKCMYYGDNDIVHALTKGRSDNYFFEDITKNLNEEDTKRIKSYNKNCLITIWGMTHFILYFCLGLFAPDYFWLNLTISVLFEYYEHLKWDCHDIFDIVLNTSGLLTGYYLQVYLC